MTNEISPEFTRNRLQLMLHHPYLASAVARLPVVNATGMKWCDTMATDGYYIYVNPTFCETLTPEETQAVIAHELLHCMLGHIDRRGIRNRKQWNHAIDYVTNQLLIDFGFNLPASGLYDRRFRGLTAEAVYEILMTKSQAEPNDSDVVMGLPDNGVQRVSSQTDIHLDPGDIEGTSVRAQGFPTEIERTRLRTSLVKECKSKLVGREAGFSEDELFRAQESRISWQQLLAGFFTGLRQDDFRSFPFNKKHLWRGIYLPSVGTPGPEHIVVAIDTSGSMSNKILSQALAEIDTLRSATMCHLTVVQCDAVIQDITSYDPWEITNKTFEKSTFYGRGGTSFLPPFAWIHETLVDQGDTLDALIYITDGYGEFPKQEPSYAVLWIMPESSNAKTSFGDVIYF